MSRRLDCFVGSFRFRAFRLLGTTLAVVLLAAAGDPNDAAQRGLMLFRDGSFAEAQQVWREAATAGDASSALFIGVSYDVGLGVQQDDRLALEWYRRAAERGSAPAAFNIGVLYDSGIGVARDPDQAGRWYQQAAAKGFGRAEYNLAQMYEAGSGVAADKGRAVALYRSAAMHGIAAARAKLVRYGVATAPVVRPPGDPALEQFREAQRLWLSRAPAEVANAVALFRRAAEQGNALAAYDLGYCYEKGIGVPRDLGQAVVWYRLALRSTRDDDLRNLASTGIGNLEQQIRQTQLR